jgi:putative hemolysin
MMVADLRVIGVLVVLLMTSALFSAAEISFYGMGGRAGRRPVGGRAGRLLEKLLARPALTLGVVLITITGLNYSAEAVAASWVITRLELPVWTAIVGMAVLVLIFAETVPICYAAANARRVARVAVWPMWVASGLLSLPARVVELIADRLARLLGGGPRPKAPVTEGEIRAIVDLQAEAGGLEEEEKVMIHQIFEFGDKVAREVMVPRTDMVAIAETATASEAGAASTEHRISRLPVYRGDLDTIIGMMYVKDVLPLLASGKGGTPVTAVMRQPLRVPETKKLSDLLAEFQRRRRTMAIVVDEYGGTAGLVTLEDLLEQVVGDIYDEYDVVRPAIERLGEGGVMLDGRMAIDEASEAIGVALPEGEYDSAAGLLYSRLGTVPRQGDVLELEGVTLIVEEMDGYRISRVRALTKAEPEDEAR